VNHKPCILKSEKNNEANPFHSPSLTPRAAVKTTALDLLRYFDKNAGACT
jgi:hypothetical protein